MLTFIIIFLVVLLFALLWSHETYRKQYYIAKAIDGTAGSSNFITSECQNIIDMLTTRTDIKIDRYNGNLILFDKQKVGLASAQTFNLFKEKSSLSFKPTEAEWQILYGVVNELYEGI